MYNYFMLIGKVKEADKKALKLAVNREFGVGEDIIPINVENLFKFIPLEIIKVGKIINVKGRILVHKDNTIELVGERIFGMTEGE